MIEGIRENRVLKMMVKTMVQFTALTMKKMMDKVRAMVAKLIMVEMMVITMMLMLMLIATIIIVIIVLIIRMMKSSKNE